MQVWGRVGLGRTGVRAGQENPLTEARASHVSRRSPDGNPSRRMESQAGAFASLHWITVHTIRFYEQSGLLPAPDRTEGGYCAFVSIKTTVTGYSATPVNASCLVTTLAAASV
jgi:hypothetical protein